MREIKFRGKRVDNGEWAYGDLVQPQSAKYKETKWIRITDNAVYGDKYKVDPKSVGQYTGLGDKNGKEIYEGDIVDHFGLNIKQEVIHKDGAFGYNHEYKSFISYAENSWFDWKNRKSDEIEVIGNIYEDK
jgi:uncharacterized phage protein (TIGR01671 family)